MEQLYTFHLFAGAGGGILADALLGHWPVGAVEVEPYPRGVLLQRQRDGVLPPFPVWDDVRTFRADNPETSEFIEGLRAIRDRLVICGGFPCQDISVGGAGAGLDGERSGLWREMARIIREIRPRHVFVENAATLTSRGMGRVLGDLAAMGLHARWGVLGACCAGAPHRRERMWIAATSDADQNGVQGDAVRPFSRKHAEPWGARARSLEDLLNRPSVPSSRLLRVDDGVADWMDRLKATGNGQVPAVAGQAWEVLR